MIDVYHRVYRLEFDAWDPRRIAVEDQISKLIEDIHRRVILHDAGNVKLTLVSEERTGTRKESHDEEIPISHAAYAGTVPSSDAKEGSTVISSCPCQDKDTK